MYMCVYMSDTIMYVRVFPPTRTQLVVKIQVFSWLPAGQSTDAVIHRPDLELSMTWLSRPY